MLQKIRHTGNFFSCVVVLRCLSREDEPLEGRDELLPEVVP